MSAHTFICLGVPIANPYTSCARLHLSQGFIMDVAYRCFAMPGCRLIIGDSPRS